MPADAMNDDNGRFPVLAGGLGLSLRGAKIGGGP
jgi:hypothetical protein